MVFYARFAADLVGFNRAFLVWRVYEETKAEKEG
jgi:hypothetical protein